ncbi:MAG: transcriptional regulator, CarD family [Thermoleophilia bacterium]|nr:transcriptional regulator, CarD family [Thermoleophilia bacterium]
MFEVGDTVVYPPHGAGVVVESPESDGQRMLTIRIAHNNLTLSVPDSAAAERGVRPAITSEQIDALLAGLTDEAEELKETAQLRTRAAADVERSGDPVRLAATIRDYAARQRDGAKLTAPERKVLETARRILATEIALVRSIPIDEAEALLDSSLGIEPA